MQKFEPDQLVLVRESEKENWDLARYSYCCAEEGETHIHHIQGLRWFRDDEIISYSGNEHLLGTTDAPTPKWEPKPGELVAVRQNDKTSWRPRVFAYRKGKYFVCQHEEFHNVKDDGWHYCEPLRKHFTVPEE